jgi:hypothetical protein
LSRNCKVSELAQDKQIFYIDSNDRLTGNNSDFRVNLIFDKNKEFDRVVVLQALIPQSYYLIQLGSNAFTLIEGSNQAVISITPGNYNKRSFATVLTGLLNAGSPSAFTYSVTFPNVGSQVDQGLYTYSVSGNSGVQPSFKLGTYCYEAMGFSSNSTNIFVANTLISTNVIKLKPEDQFYLHSDICSNKNDDILQDIYAAGIATYSNILFQQFDVESYSKEFISNSNNNYRFYLTDENDNIIQLNGQNIVITIMMYKKNSVWSMLNGFIKFILLKN